MSLIELRIAIGVLSIVATILVTSWAGKYFAMPWLGWLTLVPAAITAWLMFRGR